MINRITGLAPGDSLFYKARRREPRIRNIPTPIPILVGKEVPASGSSGGAVGVAVAVAVAVAVGEAVGLAVGLAAGLSVGLAVGEAVGLDVAAETVKVKAVQAWGGAASGFDSGAVGATACCLS